MVQSYLMMRSASHQGFLMFFGRSMLCVYPHAVVISRSNSDLRRIPSTHSLGFAQKIPHTPCTTQRWTRSPLDWRRCAKSLPNQFELSLKKGNLMRP
jgi:hypothetical protein